MTDLSRRDFTKAGALCLGAWTAGRAGSQGLARGAERKDRRRRSPSLWYRQPAANWNESLPLGNGRLGAMVFGGLEKEQIQLNEDTLWTGAPKPPTSYDITGPEHLPEIRRLVYENKWSEAQELFGKSMRKDKWFARYQPMASLWLEFPGHGGASEYRRELDLGDACSRVRYRSEKAIFTREAFISPVDQVMVVRLTADRPGSIHCSAYLEEERDEKGKIPGKAPARGIAPDTVVLRGCSASWDADMGRIRFECRMKVLHEGGRVAVKGNRLEIRGADSAVLIVAAATSFRNYRDISGNPGETVTKQIARASAKSYQQLLEAHRREHRRLFDRVSLELPETESSREPTDVRIQKVAAGGVDPDLEALLFQLGRYLLICSSRPGTQAANLQGIWNKDYQPAWDGKYTSNINLEMNYWAAETTNLSECIEPLVRLVEELSVPGAITARDGYGAGGWAFGFNTDLWRTTGPVSGADGRISFWSTWQTAGAWLCAQLYDSYRFTGDQGYLRRIYPLMKGAAEFFLDTLQKHPREGYLVTCPSSSPENRHHKIEGKPWALQPSICAGPTMDNQILRDLFAACIEAGGELGVDAEFRRKVEATARKLPPTKIGRYGQIQEWLDDWDDPKDAHRHLSHLYGLYPGREITPEKTPALAKAARVTIRHRGLLSTGWSMAWKIAFFARLQDAEMSHKGIRYMLTYRENGREGNQKRPGFKGGVFPNLLCSHPPFQIDGNLGVCAGIAEMLLQSHNGTIHLLPALPKAWKEGRATGLRARGGFEVDIHWSEGRLQRAVVRSHLGRPCHLRYASHSKDLETKKGQDYELNAALRRLI